MEPAMPTHDATRDPDTMTAAERRAEAASIFARGMVRAVREARARTAQSAEIQPEPAPPRLDSPAELRLSVAPRPRG
jgi:hypothetical protein